jgi:tetratricopeptide (TPR) repeat protein
MRNGFALLLALVVGTASAQEGNLDKLRQAAWMPSVTIMAGVGFSSEGGFSMMHEKPDPKPRIESLSKQLRGDDSDADRYLRLSRLHSQAGDTKAAKEARKKAEASYRRLLKVKPDDGLLMTRLADCLRQDDPETERLLRQAVNVPSGGWEAWMALGDCLHSKAFCALFGKDKKVVSFSPQAVIGQIVQHRPSPEDIDRALRWFSEARGCFDRALAAEPPTADAHAHCGMTYCWGDMIVACVGMMRGQQVNPMAAMFAPQYLVHFRRAAELSPNDFRAIGWATFYEALSALLQAGPPRGPADRPWILFSESTRQSVAAGMARMETLAKGKDRKEAAACSELLGTFYTFLRGDMARGEALLRRAVELNPDRDNAWEMMLGQLAAQDRDKEVLAVALQYSRHKDTAHTRFLVAKGHEKLKQLDQAEVQVRAALKMSPDSQEATLGLVSLLLKRSAQAGVLEEAGRVLERAEELLNKDKARKYQRDYDVNRGIYLGLKGDCDAARRLLEGVLEKDKKNRVARAALDALGK